ncbi:carbohydrate ABC transporter permease [Sphaerochaeta halotolerans]|jgi:glucose/mannose transport system permease protein|uniref:Sugar ABC transporter permease n=2 Tax=Sphaerochaeta halotolerans TaxID=2293840 RepID=A0A372MD99_9SPIR|nr:sugar ABC transporter permease [Sphaerochaeta halotolerans]MBG0767860.1 sugar ABC transporter permease [Spirochaetaceae bacterium]MDK2860367.1 glucose/mannose transport system permease protein [Sphaerochaeta sp.]MDN5333001.1 glucose/mannose transport system permease protein [Sphaerochaeta sp.]MXI86138.1 ABC transporter permease subunit [Sphaerochaeta halotolerans]RFU93752.1 sugar ABC transporter permease [Sphaerochaeta halotolerans]
MYCAKKDRRIAVLILLPMLLVLFIFVYGFIAWSLRISFTDWNSILPNMTSVGFENYQRLFSSQRFQTDIRNTIFFTLFFLVICIVGGFFLSYLLYSKLRGESFLRTIYLFPLSLSFVVTGVLWRWIFSPEVGINSLFRMMGFEATFGWFTSTYSIGGFNVALIALIIAASWQYLGYTMAMFLAGLRGIPDQLIESAQIDGAGELAITWYIILPLIKPITFSAMIVLGHISLKIFDLAYVMTGKGPAFVTDFPGLFMFETTFRGNHYAEGAAISIIMLILVAVVIVPYLISTLRGDSE